MLSSVVFTQQRSALDSGVAQLGSKETIKNTDSAKWCKIDPDLASWPFSTYIFQQGQK